MKNNKEKTYVLRNFYQHERRYFVKQNKILVISNDKEFSEEINESLNSNDYKAKSFTYSDIYNITGIPAPDLIILDLYISDYFSFEIIENIKKNIILTDTPIIAISSYFNEDDEKFSLKNKFGFDECLIKPVSPNYIIEKIRNILNKNKVKKEQLRKIIN